MHKTSQGLFLQALALIYLIAFASLIPQILGLIGSNGIQPARSFLGAAQQQLGHERFWTLPTLAWISSSDTVLKAMCWSGVALSIMLIAGIAPVATLLGLWVLYLSIANIGQDFLLFQWDALLLEAGFAALLIAPWGLRPGRVTPPGTAVTWLFRLLIFRLMFESGLVKLLSGDKSWRNLTALGFHYQTQPLPTPLAWYANQLPLFIQKASVIGVFVIELVVPFFFLVPRRRFRVAGAWLTIAFQLTIEATGNYTFFNLLTIFLCIPLFWAETEERVPRPFAIRMAACFLIAAGALQLVTMSANTNTLPEPIAVLDDELELWHVVNHYGLFAVMTTTRPEITIEGSDDGQQWKTYEFKYKPGNPQQAPRWVAPYQPRLDWQMWFAALSNYQSTPWFPQLMLRLLEGTPVVLSLLQTNPFPDHPPRFIRAELYDYKFSDWQTRRRTGAWWIRTSSGSYFPEASFHP